MGGTAGSPDMHSEAKDLNFDPVLNPQLQMTWQTFQTLRRSALEADRDEYKRLYEK